MLKNVCDERSSRSGEAGTERNASKPAHREGAKSVPAAVPFVDCLSWLAEGEIRA